MSIADKTSHFLITQYNATGDYRFEDAAKLVDEQAAKIEELEKDAAMLDFLECQQDLSYQDHNAHWIGVDGGSIRFFLARKMKKSAIDAAISDKSE